MTITSLMDDYCPKRGFRGEHGFSLHIESGSSKILFDAAQGDAFMHNARSLGIDLDGLDAVVLSHGHYDHGGGLAALYSAFRVPAPPFFAGRGFDLPRKSRGGAGLQDVGLPSPPLPADAPEPILIDAFQEFAPGIWFLPAAEPVDGTEASPAFRLSDGEGGKIDRFDDELSLVFSLEDGIVVATGCAHRGIVNIVRAAMGAFPGIPVKAIVGGFHLVDAAPGLLSRIADDIAAIAPGAVYCSHCTGLRGFAALSARLGDAVTWLHCGMRITL